MSLWNGNKGALSLTFDDGRVSQIGFAVPEMTERGIFGTFFLVSNPEVARDYDPQVETRGDAWRKAAADGHEIGSHSVNHLKACDIDFEDGQFEAGASKKQIEAFTTVIPTSFCYPYTDVNDAIKRGVMANYKQARGGRVARKDKFLRPESDFDMFNIPCIHVGSSDMAANRISSVILEALERKSWVTLMFHTIGDGDEKAKVTPWDKVSEEQFMGMLDGLLVARQAGLWIAPFGVVAENLRQHK